MRVAKGKNIKLITHFSKILSLFVLNTFAIVFITGSLITVIRNELNGKIKYYMVSSFNVRLNRTFQEIGVHRKETIQIPSRKS
jgi:hypothetical protein